MDIWFYTYGNGYAPPGWHIRSLPYTNRLYVIESGTAYFLAPDGEKLLEPGRVYLFPHSLPFRVRQDESDRVRHLYFDFAVAPPLTCESLIELPLEPGTLMALTVECLRMAVDMPNGERLVRGYFENLMSLILEKSGASAPVDARLTPVLRFIHENYQSHISDSQLATLAHMEKNYMIRVFHRAIGMTPYQYLRQHRLNRATSLIKNGATLYSAAAQCGYESGTALAHALRSARGLNAGSIRR